MNRFGTSMGRLRAGSVLVAGLLVFGCSSDEPESTSSTDGGQPQAAAPSRTQSAYETALSQVGGGPGRAEPDLFHPDNQPDANGNRPPMPEPRKGGRVIIHLASMPRHVNYMTENSAVTHWILREVHEFLLERDWNSWQHKPTLSKGWVTEDTVVLKGGRGDDNSNILYGKVTEDGDHYVVTPASKDHPLKQAKRVAKSEVDGVERGTVFTFELRDNVRWHDGQPFDAHDVYFSWNAYNNDTVDCDDARPILSKISHAEVLDDDSIRFFYEKQYYAAVDAFTNLTIVPSHRYNLLDKDNPDYDPSVDPLGRKQGTYINDHENNFKWIGLGPYRITAVDEQFIDAERFDQYFDPDRAGYLDAIRWRHISNDDAAKAALLNGELDYWQRLRSEDYFGEFTQKPEFTDDFYKGYVYMPRMQYLAWNMRRPKFADRNVRWALAHAFDWDDLIRTQANGLGVRCTATQFILSPTYDRTVEPVPFDLERAEELLTDAGWYDRDDDGIIDKDGIPFEIEYLMTPGNKASETQALKYQENLAKLGIKLNVATRDWAAFIERIRNKDFDTFGLAWVLDVESDPEQLWHSWQGEPSEDRSANYPGINDPEIDSLIKQIQQELDDEKRKQLFHKMHRRIHDLQPYMFSYVPPVKFAVSKRVRNFWGYGLNPGYSLREWFVTDAPPASDEPVASLEN